MLRNILSSAQAGLLDGVQCTTHHDVLPRLKAAAPAALVKDNRVFVEDAGIWTSAGITAGIDLALHLINRLCGARQALTVAREMVVWFRRSGDDPHLTRLFRLASAGNVHVLLRAGCCAGEHQTDCVDLTRASDNFEHSYVGR